MATIQRDSLSGAGRKVNDAPVLTGDDKEDDGRDQACRKCLMTRLRSVFFFGKRGGWSPAHRMETGIDKAGMEEKGTGKRLMEEGSEPKGMPLTGTEVKTKRETWSGKFEFFLSCLGYCVGFGNIWRFPYLVYRNGGGAFLIPYILFLVLCGIPLVFMEMAMGQFSSLTSIHLFSKFSPLFKGLGYSMVIISFFVCIYYNTIMSWVIYYLYSSFTTKLPWSWCDPAWASPKCFSPFQDPIGDFSSIDNMTQALVQTENNLIFSKDNRTRVPAAEEYWNRHVLQISEGIDQTGSLRPELLICLAVAWISVFLCSFKGIKSSGKVVYLTATTPFIMLIVLLIRGATLPGAIDGLKLFIYPDFTRLSDFQVWTDSAMQIFYAMAPGWGGLLSFASYNDFHVNVYKYGIAIPVLNFFTSLLGGFAVFAIIGYLAHQSGVPVHQVVAQGPGLTFVAYPEALSQLPGAPVWAVLFFLTLFTIGIDSQFGMFDTFLSALTDEFRVVRKHRSLFCGGACLLLFLLGMGCVTNAGMFWVQIIDYYCAFMTLMIICITECVLVGYIYGAERFRRDIALMIGHPISYFWCISWKYLTLGTISLILFFNFYFQKAIVYEDYVFPSWSIVIGWTLAVSSTLPIPLYACVKLYRSEGSLWHRITSSIRCTADFGPSSIMDRKMYLKDVRLVPPVMGPEYPCDEEEAMTKLDQTADHFLTLNQSVASTAVLVLPYEFP
ncbi:Sodium- and chloride-dependent glycine transporter 1 [Hypsibius exemplaris]|uniref:Transporter n=1 Tax=Hypsibius exemplaris TaxID=2072580 RepID=A0A1W0WM38_HYPEX|nr:Sodium- and chloride-dependent glycine transporter 1 [Hypsibius exemplaris]